MKRGLPAPVLLAVFWIGSLFAVSLFAERITLVDPSAINIAHVLEPPSAAHWLGTDQLGRDVLTRLLFGTRIALLVGFVAVGIASLVGVFLGSMSGYFGGWTDRIIMGFVDIMLCFPTFFLILAVVALLEPGITHIMIIIGLTSWMGMARLIRAEILSLKEREFVLAARAIGASDSRILAVHLIPNALGPVLVAVTLGVANAILVESSLSFLGIGVQPPTPSWGNMLTDGKAALGVAWWLTLFPGLAILFTVLSYNLIGEHWRERFHVRSR